MGTLLDLYNQGETTFREQAAHDLDDGEVWFNMDEFASFHDINGVKVLSLFVADKRNQTTAAVAKLVIRMGGQYSPEGVFRSGGVLYVRAQEIEGVAADQPLRLDGRLYTVLEARLLQDQVWRIALEANES